MRTTVKRYGLGVLVVAASMALLAGCAGNDENTAFNKMNADRVANGPAALASDAALVTKSHAWAKHLATASGGVCNDTVLVHSTLTDGAPAGWHALGENIACATTTGTVASTLGLIETMLMNHPPHRANIVSTAYNHGAVGLASVPAKAPGTGIVVFEVQDFAGL